MSAETIAYAPSGAQKPLREDARPDLLLRPLLGVEEAGRPRRAGGEGGVQAQPEAEAGSRVTADKKVCTCGRPMRVELSGRVVGGKGARVVLLLRGVRPRRARGSPGVATVDRTSLAVAAAKNRRAALLAP
jgi:hypothetical protein